MTPELLTPELGTHVDPERDREVEARFYAACIVFVVTTTLATLALSWLLS